MDETNLTDTGNKNVPTKRGNRNSGKLIKFSKTSIPAMITCTHLKNYYPHMSFINFHVPGIYGRKPGPKKRFITTRQVASIHHTYLKTWHLLRPRLVGQGKKSLFVATFLPIYWPLAVASFLLINGNWRKDFLSTERQ